MSEERTIPNVVVIPTRDHAETHCVNLVHQLIEQRETYHILVYDNRDELPESQWMGPTALIAEANLIGDVNWIHAPGMTITQMWNHGWGSAVVHAGTDPVNVAILNDDLVIPEGFIGIMADKLREEDRWLVCPDYTKSLAEIKSKALRPRMWQTREVHGTYREGGWCGWAYMIRGELLGAPLPPIDEQFLWWCGDDDLDRQIHLHGGTCGLIEDLPLDHLGTMTGQLHPELHSVGWEDLARFQEKYRS